MWWLSVMAQCCLCVSSSLLVCLCWVVGGEELCASLHSSLLLHGIIHGISLTPRNPTVICQSMSGNGSNLIWQFLYSIHGSSDENHKHRDLQIKGLLWWNEYPSRTSANQQKTDLQTWYPWYGCPSRYCNPSINWIYASYCLIRSLYQNKQYYW